MFKDITPLLADGDGLRSVLNDLADPWLGRGVTKVVGVESRGFLLAPGVAERLGCGVALVRKPGKLPWTTVRAEYALEYGTDSLEMHVDALVASERVLLIDDVLATGGTASAAMSLIASSGATCLGAAFVIELSFLNGRSALIDYGTTTSIMVF